MNNATKILRATFLPFVPPLLFLAMAIYSILILPIIYPVWWAYTIFDILEKKNAAKKCWRIMGFVSHPIDTVLREGL